MDDIIIETHISELIYVIGEQNEEPHISTDLLRAFLDKYGVNSTTRTGITIFDYIHDMTNEQLDTFLNEYLIKECKDSQTMYYIDEMSDPRLLLFLLQHDQQGRYARIKTHYAINGKIYTLLRYLKGKRCNRVDVYTRKTARNIYRMIDMMEEHTKKHLTLFEIMFEHMEFDIQNYNKRQRFQ